jgi:hypothetical protein
LNTAQRHGYSEIAGQPQITQKDKIMASISSNISYTLAPSDDVLYLTGTDNSMAMATTMPILFMAMPETISSMGCKVPTPCTAVLAMTRFMPICLAA